MATTAPSQAPTQAPTPTPTPAPTPAPTPKPITKTAKRILVQPVYGPMVNLYTSQRIDGVTEVPEIDGWLQAQIEAGKITQC